MFRASSFGFRVFRLKACASFTNHHSLITSLRQGYGSAGHSRARRDHSFRKRLNAASLLARLHLMRVFSRLFVIVALCFAIGLHWCALQSIAWTTMVIEYSKDAPFTEALAKALDGQHPCSLCQAVQTGKKSEQKNNVRTVTKIDFYCAASPNPRTQEFLRFEFAVAATAPIARADSPLTPPPRFAA